MLSDWRFSRNVIHTCIQDTAAGAEWVAYRAPPKYRVFAYECRHGNTITKIYTGIFGHRFVLSFYNGGKLETCWAWRWQCSKLMRLIGENVQP